MDCADPGVFDRVNAEGAAQRRRRAPARPARGRVVHTSTFDVFERRRGGTVSEDAGRRLRRRAPPTSARSSSPRSSCSPRPSDGIEVVSSTRPAVYRARALGARPGWTAAFRDALRERLPAVPPGGMTLTYVDDVAAGHVAASTAAGPASATSSPTASRTIARDLSRWPSTRRAAGRVPPHAARPASRAALAPRRRGRLPADPPPAAARPQASSASCSGRRAPTARRRGTELGIEFTPWRRGRPADGASGCERTGRREAALSARPGARGSGVTRLEHLRGGPVDAHRASRRPRARSTPMSASSVAHELRRAISADCSAVSRSVKIVTVNTVRLARAVERRRRSPGRRPNRGHPLEPVGESLVRRACIIRSTRSASTAVRAHACVHGDRRAVAVDSRPTVRVRPCAVQCD